MCKIVLKFVSCNQSRLYISEVLTSGVQLLFRNRFPKDEKRRAQWVKFVNIPNFIPPVKCYICSQHFPEESLDRTSDLKVQLKGDAVPSINISRIKFVSILSQITLTINNVCTYGKGKNIFLYELGFVDKLMFSISYLYNYDINRNISVSSRIIVYC